MEGGCNLDSPLLSADYSEPQERDRLVSPLLLSEEDLNIYAFVESLGSPTESHLDTYNFDENDLIEELENLAYRLDGAAMTIEDFRSHELRRTRTSDRINIRCTRAEVEYAYWCLGEVLTRESSECSLSLGHSTLVLVIGSPELLSTAAPQPILHPLPHTVKFVNKVPAKDRLDFYNATIKQAKLQLLKDKEAFDKERARVGRDLAQVKAAAKELSLKAEHIRKKLSNFVERLEVLSRFYVAESQSTTPATPAEIIGQISALETLASQMFGIQKDKVVLQINRLKTQLTKVRSEAILSGCQTPVSTWSQDSLQRITPPKLKRDPSESVTRHIRQRTEGEMRTDSHDQLRQELLVMQARMEDKLEELYERGDYLLKRANHPKGSEDYQISLYYLEKRLMKVQQDVDNQKLSLAKRMNRHRRAQDELELHQETFQSILSKCVEETQELIQCLAN